MGPPTISDAFTVAIIGDSGVGKSALVKRFAQGYFVEDHIPTIEDVHTRSIPVTHRTYDLHIWDTGAPDRQPSGRVLLTERLRAHALRADGIVLCYSVTDADSFRAALALYKQIQAVRADKVPVFLAATKADPSLLDLRQVRPLTQGNVLAQLGVAEDMYAETCARQNRDCSKVFFSLTRAILAAKAEAKAQARLLKKGHLRAESSPALPLETLSLSTGPSRSNSLGEIEFDSSSSINTAARPPSSAHQLPQQPTLGHQRSKSLSRTTTSMRKQKEGARTIGVYTSVSVM
jgi:GTPase SAR1 family protein